MISKNRSAVLLILAGTIAVLAGCHKHPASIVGVWTANSQRTVDQSKDSTTSDTTVQIPSGQIILIFNGDGSYSFQLPSVTTTGTYAVNGSTLALYKNGNPPASVYHIVTLTSSAFSYQYTDTIITNPLTTVQYTTNCTN